MAVRHSKFYMVWICWRNYWNVAYDQVEMSKGIHMLKKVFRVRLVAFATAITLLLTLTGCGSSFSEKDLAACQSAWDNTSDAVSSAPRATYNDSAPDPSFAEITRHYEDLLSSRSELISLAAKVDSSALKVALMDFAIGTGNMALDFLNNPRAKGTSGITEFNDTFKVVIDMCKDAGWEY